MAKTIRLTVAQALVKFLNNQYIEFDGKENPMFEGIFGIFGHGNIIGIGQALEEDAGHLIMRMGRNEQGMAHSAIGFAKQKRRKQMYACTSSVGPGAANMVTAAATATANCIPILFLPGDTYADRQPDPVLQQMERTGVLIDSDLLAQQSKELGQRLLELEVLAHEAAGQPFNVNSPKQLAEILFTKLGLPVKKKTPSGTPSTDEEVLSELALDYPLPKLLLESRQLAKLKGTYTDKLPKMINAQTGRVHTSYAQAVAVTGRLASSDPNLQNIPVRSTEGRRIRAAFIAPPGAHIVSADYSQIELRIMAHLSEDARLLEAFAQGEDVHRATAAEIFGVTPIEVGADQRRVAKVINFGLIYGMSAFGLARQLDLERSAAQAYIERYFARYPGVARYMESTRNTAKMNGYVETVFGRRLWLPEIRAAQVGRRQGAERAAINAPMQGTAADLIKLAMIAVQGWLDREKLKTRLVMQVHDELILEVPDDELPRVRIELPPHMTQVAKLRVPLAVEVGVGANWDEAH